jgi:pimeloyl-ACP methyl ester carboxylesterase
MTKPLLHFAHGNSFPAGTYRQYLDGLREAFDVRVIEMQAHDPRFPVTDGWPALVAELIVQLETYPGPAILVGHSLGGMLCAMAAKQRPELVRCVVMLDAPVVAGWRAALWRLTKKLGQASRVSPSRFSARRRQSWPDMRTAFQHFVNKPLFASWAPGVLNDYLEHGFEPDPQGVRLRFDRAVETAIYNALPHHLGSFLATPFPVPVGFIGGTESVELRQAGAGATKRLVGRHFAWIPGGHLYPMESPRLAADMTRQMIDELLKQPA